MQKIFNEIDRRVVKLAKQEKEAKTKILKAQYSAAQTTLVLFKMWIIDQNKIKCPVCNKNEVLKEFNYSACSTKCYDEL